MTGRRERKQFTLMLDWFPTRTTWASTRLWPTATSSKAGLDVHVQVPSDPATPLKLLPAGKIDAAISYEPEVLLARNQGQPLVSVAAIVQRAADLDRVDRLQAHHGPAPSCTARRVGDAGIPYQHAYLTTILARAASPLSSVKEINVGANLVPGDALGPGRRHARRVLELRGDPARAAPQAAQRDPHGAGRRPHLRRARGRRSQGPRSSTSPTCVRRFVQALARGYEAVRTRPPDRRSTTWSTPAPAWTRASSWRASRPRLPAFFPSDPANPWGWQEPKQWTAYGQWMLSNHLISNPNAVVDASTNELLAGQGL